MAFKEVVLTEEEQKQGSGNRYRKFAAIGDKHFGVFLGTRVDNNGSYGPQTKYVLWTSKEGHFELPSAFDLDKKVAKAQRSVQDGGQGLYGEWTGTGKPHAVRFTFTSTQDIGQTNPMKIFKVEADTDLNLPAGTRVPTLTELYPPQRAAQGPQPSQRQPNPPPPDDDIPF